MLWKEAMPVLTQKLFHLFFAHVYVDTGVVVVDPRSTAGVGAADGPLEEEKEHQAPESPQHRMLPAPGHRRAATSENPSLLPQHYSRCLALSTSVVVPPGVRVLDILLIRILSWFLTATLLPTWRWTALFASPPLSPGFCLSSWLACWLANFGQIVPLRPRSINYSALADLKKEINVRATRACDLIHVRFIWQT